MTRQTGLPTISRRDDGRFWARIEAPRVNGKRRWRYIYGKTKQEVREQLIPLLAQQQQGMNIAPERLTVGQFLAQWIERVLPGTVRYRTVKRYELAVRVHIVPHLGRISLAKLTPQHVQQLMSALQDQGLKPATIQRTRDMLVMRSMSRCAGNSYRVTLRNSLIRHAAKHTNRRF